MSDWSQIVHRHGPLVWKTIVRLVECEQDAADCFQNVFLSAIEVEQREPVRHWPALLQRLATARAMDCLRQRYRLSNQVNTPLDLTPQDSEQENPISHLSESELKDELLRALTKLEAKQAHVFWRVCIEEADYREISEELEITVNHVGVLLNRARSTLRERLRAFAPETPKTPAREIQNE